MAVTEVGEVGELTRSQPGEDPDLLRERFVRDGYLCIEGLLDPAAVLDVRRAIIAALVPVGWLRPDPDPSLALPGPEVHIDFEDDWWPGYTVMQSLECFHALAHSEPIVRVIGALLGEDPQGVLVHPRNIGRLTYPGSERATPPHQDFPLVQGAVDTLTAWVPLGDCPTALGGLRVLTGSPAAGLRPVVERKGVGGVGVDPQLDRDDRWRTVDYRAGDVLVFHCLTVHQARPNAADVVRLSADYRYQAAGDPIAEPALLPHGYPKLPGWDELSRGWSTTRWVIPDRALTVVPLQDPRGPLRPPPSRFWPLIEENK